MVRELRHSHDGPHARFLSLVQVTALERAGAIYACEGCAEMNPEAGVIFHATEVWLICLLCKRLYPMLPGFDLHHCASCRSKSGEAIFVLAHPLH